MNFEPAQNLETTVIITDLERSNKLALRYLFLTTVQNCDKLNRSQKRFNSEALFNRSSVSDVDNLQIIMGGIVKEQNHWKNPIMLKNVKCSAAI